MSDDEIGRAEIMGKLDTLGAGVKRLERKLEKDADDLFDRVRALEIGAAVSQQAFESSVVQSRRTFALVATIVGSSAGAVVSLLAKFFAG